jgi:hypothetical protein
MAGEGIAQPGELQPARHFTLSPGSPSILRNRDKIRRIPLASRKRVYILSEIIMENERSFCMKFVSVVSCMLSLLGTMLLNGCDSSTGHGNVDLTPPPVPTNLSISQIGNGSVTLTWNAVSDTDLHGYNVYWQGDAVLDTLKANRRFITTNTIILNDLNYETEYSFAVTSIDASGNESALSVSRNGTPYNTTPPLPPTGIDLVAENIDFSKITLYWAENTEPDIAHYNVYRALSLSDADSDLAPLATVSETSYIDIAIEAGVSYYYWVKAVDRGGKESNASAYVNDVVLPKVSLTSPVSFQYVGATPTFIWKQIAGAKKYNVVVTTSRIGGEIWNVEVDGAITQVAYGGKTRLISGNTYYWKVGAISRTEINSVSSIGSFVVRSQ